MLKISASIAGLAILVVIGWELPTYTRFRSHSAESACINNLRQFDGAKLQWAFEHNKTNEAPSWEDIRSYVKLTASGEFPKCPQGGKYTLGRLDERPHCTVMRHNFDFGLVEVTDKSG